jgi:hypothetical protein
MQLPEGTLIRILVLAFIASVPAAFGQTGLTFFATSDVHYGQNDDTKSVNRSRMPGYLNALAGKNYPASAGGGPVGVPRGVLMPGDLIEESSTYLWGVYAAAYGLKKDGTVKIPVYDALGNHEFYGSVFPTIAANFKKRNIERKNILSYNIKDLDTANHHYSWEWDGIFFVNLNVWGGLKKTLASGVPNAFNSITFLKKTLERNVGRSGRPVFVMQHYPFDDEVEKWWPVSDRAALITLLKQYNCIGILHGHTHGKKFYKHQGIDIFDDGTVMKGDHLVFRIDKGKMLVMNRINDAWGSLQLEKEISMGATTGLEPPKPGEGRLPAFRLTVDGVGEIYAGRAAPTAVEVLSLDGRAVRSLPVAGGSVAWDRRDRAGRSVPAGVYLFRIRTAAGQVHAKVIL